MSELISVIIPVYKVEPYLRRCVDSVIAQTYSNLEIFLVDDGSPDLCGEICDEYAEKDERIRVIHKKNGGLSDARNVAIDVCQGEYISFIDSDDYVDNDFIESLYRANKSNKTELSICGIMKFDESGDMHEDYVPSDSPKCASGTEMAETVWRPAACNKLYHRSLFEGIRYPVGKLYEDLFIYHDILAKVDRVSFTGKNSYYYFDRQSSIMNKSFDVRNCDLVEGLDLRIKKLREMGFDDLADRQLSFIFNQTVDAYVKMKDPNAEDKARQKEAKAISDRHYKEMMSYRGFTARQKTRITMFRYFPKLYLHLHKSGL